MARACGRYFDPASPAINREAGALAQTERLIAVATDEAGRKRPRQIKAALSISLTCPQLHRSEAGMAAGGKPADLAAVAALVVANFEQQSENRGPSPPRSAGGRHGASRDRPGRARHRVA